MPYREATKKASDGATLVFAYYPFLSDTDLKGLKIFIDSEIKEREDRNHAHHKISD